MHSHLNAFFSAFRDKEKLNIVCVFGIGKDYKQIHISAKLRIIRTSGNPQNIKSLAQLIQI
jgi:hypothetical protein